MTNLITNARKVTGNAIVFISDMPSIRFFLKNGGCTVYGQDDRLNNFVPIKKGVKKMNKKIANKRFTHNVKLLKKHLKKI